MIKLAVSGCHGRMGQAITKLALQKKDIFEIKALLEHKDHPKVNEPVEGIPVHTDNSVLKGSDVLIEFTLPEGTLTNLKAAVANNVRMVIGTTGFTAEQTEEIKAASAKIPIVFASNMSIGVNVLFKLIEITSKKLGANAINISETHHIHKKDQPSGTAKTMGEVAEQFSGLNVMDSIVALRQGEVVGDHEIIFDSDEDILTISHHAKDRTMFAKGALEAAKFLMDKENGLYNMQDVLGLANI
ncbi:MAG: 4-hydroxy-tetrahydrodipicolinate reductase [Candidatus Omnitrophica bacterium]|nr:4-hydroxy-tetrahydrodipicolinate reductase [Candidatus Omnitrophota bacterium]